MNTNTNNTQSWTLYKLFQLFHTTTRNSIILTTLSLSLLGYSRYYRDKNNIYNLAFIILSLLFICASIMVNSFLLYDQLFIKNIMHNNSNENIVAFEVMKKWYIIPLFLIIANISIGIFGLYTLFRFL